MVVEARAKESQPKTRQQTSKHKVEAVLSKGYSTTNVSIIKLSEDRTVVLSSLLP